MSSTLSARTSLNLKVLRRHDPSIVTILETASFVVLYNYNDGEWTKTGVEGPLFLFRRRVPPYNGFFLMNRNGVENFSADITPDDDLEITPEFIIYRPETSNEVYGIWVFEANQRMFVGDKLLKLQQMMDGPSEEELKQAESAEAESKSVAAGDEKQTASTAVVAAGQKSAKDAEGKAVKTKANGKPKKNAKQVAGKSNDEDASARATAVSTTDVTVDSVEGTQINLDDLFGTPAVPAQFETDAAEPLSEPVTESASKGAESNDASLLDSLFQKASLDTRIANTTNTTTEASKASAPEPTDHSQNLLALLSSATAASTKPSSTPPPNCASNPPSTEKTTQAVRTSSSSPAPPKSGPKMSELIEQGIRDHIGLGDDNQPLSRREFVTELLSMIHVSAAQAKQGLYCEVDMHG